MTPHLANISYNWDALLSLLYREFFYMEDRIDPPSSLHTLTIETIADRAARREGIVVDNENGTPIACVFISRQADHLYIGKLAVDTHHRGRGLARLLITFVEDIARAFNLPKVQLETRIELVENHAAFAAMGFVKTQETAHAGYDRPTGIIMEKFLT